jgi:hypothetical protein
MVELAAAVEPPMKNEGVPDTVEAGTYVSPKSQ